MWPGKIDQLESNRAIFMRIVRCLYSKLQCNTAGIATFDHASELDMREAVHSLPAALHLRTNLANHSCVPNLIKTYEGRWCISGFHK